MGALKLSYRKERLPSGQGQWKILKTQKNQTLFQLQVHYKLPLLQLLTDSVMKTERQIKRIV